MIHYLEHNSIDKQRWDACISGSCNRRVYAFSWYLDIVSPGWDALAEEDYTSVFPLTHNRKWGVSYLYQPYFAQQLGLFSVKPVTAEYLGRFIAAVPRCYRFIEIQLNAMNEPGAETGSITQRVNHELDIAPGYGEISGRFAQNTRRNIRKSKELAVTAGRDAGVDELIGMFSENFGRKEGKLQEKHYQVLRELIVYCQSHNLGYILGARDSEGELGAAAFFLFDGPHVYFLFAASSLHARDNGAMFSLVDHFLSENGGKYKVLDFEGGNDPNLGRFYKSFGAEEVYYPALFINRLPAALNRLLYFYRRLRE
ncbi:MAG: GNAT family N-acetyltransferase [Bacteroidota bacterium]